MYIYKACNWWKTGPPGHIKWEIYNFNHSNHLGIYPAHIRRGFTQLMAFLPSIMRGSLAKGHKSKEMSSALVNFIAKFRERDSLSPKSYR